MRIFTRLSVVTGLICLLSCQKANNNNNIQVEYFSAENTLKLDLPFSDAAKVGNLLFVSGQIGNLPGTTTLASGGITGETRQALENIKAILEANGSSMNNIIKCTVMLADINEWADMNSVYVSFFPMNKPVRSTFATAGLAMNARIEIECIAFINK